MQQLGDVLTKAREKMGLTIEDVAQITKIRSKYIQALELGDMDAIPGRVYALGFLKSYCELLNLDYKELQEYFNANYQEKDDFEKSLATAVPEERKVQMNNIANKRVVVIALVGACVLFGGIYFFVKTLNQETEQPPIIPPVVDNEPDDTQQPQEPVDPDPNETEQNHGAGEDGEGNLPPVNPDSPQEPDSPVVQEGITVVVEATGKCWTRSVIDGGSGQEETLNAGDIRTYTGKEKVVMKFGNAGAVKVTVNGELLSALGKNGQVVTREFSAEE